MFCRALESHWANQYGESSWSINTSRTFIGKKLSVVSLGFPPLLCSVWGVGADTARFCFVSFSFLGSVKREVRGWLQAWRSDLVLPVSHDWPSIPCLTAWGQFSSLPCSITCSGSNGCLPFAVFPHARDQCRGSP